MHMYKHTRGVSIRPYGSRNYLTTVRGGAASNRLMTSVLELIAGSTWGETPPHNYLSIIPEYVDTEIGGLNESLR